MSDTLAETTLESNPYGGASAGAIADLSGAPPASTPATPPGQVAPDPPASSTATPPAATPTTPLPDDVIEVRVNGRVEQVSLKDRERLIELTQKGLDYTQKTQTAAEERRQVEAYAQALSAREAEMATFLRDPVKVTQYAQYLLGQQQAQGTPPDPNAPTSIAEVRQMLQAELQQVRQDTAKVVAQAQFTAEVAKHQSDYEGELHGVVKGVLEKFPVLDSVAESPEDLLEMLKGDLARKGLQPTSIGEAKEMLADLAKTRADRLHTKMTDHAKMEAVRAAKLTKTGTEPPGGGAPSPQAQHFKLGDPRLQAQAIADMEASKRG